MKRSGVAALSISAVDVVRGQQPLYSRQVAFLSGIEQRCVASQQVSNVLVALSHQL